MNYKRAATGITILAGGVVFLALAPQRTAAAVLDTKTTLDIRVQELIDGTPASFSEDNAEFPAANTTLPLAASARVESTDLEGVLVAVGQGFSAFADPTRLEQDNPEELALEVACFSNAPNVVYQVNGLATETRSIVFTNGSGNLAPSEIAFRLDGTREIESRVFISGAILLWTPNLDTDGDGFPNNSLDGLTIDARLSVTRLTDENDNNPATLFDTSISLSGSGGTLAGPDTVGPIVLESSNVDALVAEGLDEASAAALRTVAAAGSLTILLVPHQEHAYRYEVRANEAFLLRADLTIDIRNIAGGSGIAVAIGRPFSELTNFVENALAGIAPKAIEQSINALVARSNVGLVRTEDQGGGGAMCGALGVEMVPLLLGFAFVSFRRRTL